jgi:hypothetical protein
MGMTASFRRLSSEDLSRLVDDPQLLADYLGEEDPSGDFGPFVELDIDKAWHAIHFLLTGTAWEGDHPWNFIVKGGTAIGGDLGYGPARALTSAQVREIAAALESMPVEKLSERFDAKALTAAQIYPQIWDRPAEEDDTREYVTSYYEELCDFVLAAAAKGEAMLVYLS